MADEAFVTGCCCTTIESGQVGIVQRFGAYVTHKPPGLVLYCAPICTVTPHSVGLQTISAETECKTADDVTLTARVTVRYQLDQSNLKKGIFEIVDHEAQIKAAVDDIVRSTIPTMPLDEAYTGLTTLTDKLRIGVAHSMSEYGWQIMEVKVEDLSPDDTVKNAMNMIVEATRRKTAAEKQGQAAYTLEVKAAQADMLAKKLSGQGSAQMRIAIAKGFKDSMEAMTAGGLTPQEAIHLMVTTQYIDTMKDFAVNKSKSSIMITHSPGAVEDIQQQVKAGFQHAMSKK